MAKIINITIDPKKGTRTIDLDGFVGTECTDITNVMTKGQQITENVLKAEYAGGEKLPVWTDES